MAFVRVEQRNAHLAGDVRLDFVNGREGRIAKGTVTAISNTRRSGRGEDGGGGSGRDEESTAIQWTLWGKQAENAAEYLGRGSHVNIVGRLRNNIYERDGETVYGMTFTVEEIDYLNSKADSDARRARTEGGTSADAPVTASSAAPPARVRAAKPAAGRTAT